MHAMFHDVRHAWRSLMKTPGFAAVAIITLALGIGAATAIFTVVNAVLLQPLRFADPQQLTMIWTSIHSRVPPAYIDEWRARSQAMNDVAGWRDDRVNLTGRGEPSELLADLVTSNFFAVLGVPASLGRTFTVAPTLNVVESEVVLSHRFWQRRYGGDTAVIGQSLTLDGRSFTIIGVMPERFAIRTLELAESRPDVWLPLALAPGDPDAMSGILHVVGRLKAGATVERAQAELTLIARNVEGRQASSTREWSIEVVPLLEATVRDVRLTMLVLAGAVIILLLIACANVGNLLLSRGAARRQELAIRQSLGATAGRLVRQLLTESFLLATFGGILGFVTAVLQTKLLVSALPTSLDFPRIGEVTVDARMLLFALSVTSLSAMLFGLVPAWMSASSASPLAAAGTARGSSFSGPHVRFSAALIVVEIALAVTVLAGAGLLVRSFWNLTRVNPGFDASHVTTMRTALPASKYDTDDRVRLFGRDLLRRMESLPGVDAAGVASYLPLSRVGRGGSFQIEGRAADRASDRPGSWFSVVGGNYFEAMGIPLLRGRVPTDADTEMTQPVFVIDEGLAERYWPGEDPVGARVSWQVDEVRTLTGQVVGVVGGVRWGGIASRPQATTYLWFPQRPERQLTIVARAPGDSAAVAQMIAAEVRGIDADQPVADIRTMQNFVSDDLAQSRFTMFVLTGFAAASLLLAAIGLYGVIAYNVAQRTREIGIRMALGAHRWDVLALVLRRGFKLTALGLSLGISVSIAAGHLVTRLLFGIAPTDAVTLTAVAVLSMLVAFLATCVPARRAARVDPLVALRYE